MEAYSSSLSCSTAACGKDHTLEQGKSVRRKEVSTVVDV